MSKERIVKFSDGTYGIQKGRWFFSTPLFLNLDDYGFWYTQKHKYFRCCKNSLEKVTQIFNNRNVHFTPFQLETDLSVHM